MIWLDEFGENNVENANGSEPEANGQLEGLYPGDCGQLPIDTRRLLVQLLLGPSLDGRRHSRLWEVLRRDEAVVKSRLADLFLELIIDYGQQVAFTRQADVGVLEAPVLLRRSPLTFLDSIVLLFLRQRLTQADVRGERAVVEDREISENAAPFERAANTDHAGFTKRIQASVEKMKKNSILQKIRGSEDRYEISPTLKLLFESTHVAELTRQYQALAENSEANNALAPEEEQEIDL